MEKGEKLRKLLENNSYYWRQIDKNPIEYAYLHIDEDYSDFTFLIVFENSEAEKYDTYCTCGKSEKEIKSNSSIIRNFISEVEKYDSTKNCNCWHINRRPRMTLANNAFDIVNNTIDKIKKKRKEQIEKNEVVKRQ